MNEDKLGAKQLVGYLKEKRSLWLIAAAFVIGIALMLFSPTEDVKSTSITDDASEIFALETRLKQLCEHVKGVSDVSVMITPESYGEQQYAADVQTRSDGAISEERAEFVTVSQGLVPTAKLSPKIRGIAVVCKGGGDASIKLKLTSLITALFDVSAAAVSIEEAG